MVLKRIIILLTALFLMKTSYSQELVYTDKYQNNFFKTTVNEIYFHNASFFTLNQSQQKEVEQLINQFLSANQLEAVELILDQENGFYKVTFQVNNTNFSLFALGVQWKENYQLQLKTIIEGNLSIQELDHINAIFLHKLAYYLNANNRFNSFIETRLNINIQSKHLHGLNDIIQTNFQMNRLLTNHNDFFLQELFFVDLADDEKAEFYIGPNYKSRLSDCVSMHLLEEIYPNHFQVFYFNNYSIIYLTKQLNFTELNEINIEDKVPNVISKLKQRINDASHSFYNIYDYEKLDDFFEEYTKDDLMNSIQLFLDAKQKNELINITNENAIVKAILDDSLQFKSNVVLFENPLDTNRLNNIAQFLTMNSNQFDKLVITGASNKTELLKIDKKQFLKAIEPYKDYSPVKYSKKKSLSLYRAFTIFHYLVEQGVDPTKMVCNSNQTLNAKQVYFTLIK